MATQQPRPHLSHNNGQRASLGAEVSHLVGAWRLTIAPAQGTPAPALVTVGADGTLSVATLPVEPFLGAAEHVIFVSAMHGLWQPIDPNTVSFKIVGLAATERGALAGSATITGRLGLSAHDGGTLDGTYEAAVYDPAGREMATEKGAMRATRIVFEER